ncbi:MAG TPA: TetR/AcrR family transcriptional regulator [Acidimicrobiales bacterium]|nr:TetR/AcrR family transcriptional regulator [Acidimicrobiales bacterium]
MGPGGTLGAGNGRAAPVGARSGTPKSGSTTSAGSRAKAGRAAKASDVAGEPASRRALRSQGRKTMRKLLDAAMIVFARRGYYAARVDDIVKVARTSHGTFYLYFSNKEDLLRALVAEAGEVVATLDTSLGPIGPDDQGWRELRRWMDQFSEAWQRYAPVLRAWTDLAMSDAELSAQGHAAAGAVAQTLASRVAEKGPQPGIDPHAAAVAVVAMVERFHYLRQFAGQPVDARALDTLTTMVHRALFGGGTPPARYLAGAATTVLPKKARPGDGVKAKKP